MGQKSLTIQFDATHRAQAIYVQPDAPPAGVLTALNLPPYRHVVTVHGGAGNMAIELVGAVQDFLLRGLIPLAEQEHILVADGGTDVGVMHALGAARAQAHATFPLVGVTPHRFARFPGSPTDGDREALNSAHTHFVLVEGDDFGVESALLVGLLRGSGRTGFALVINGGGIVFDEVKRHAAQGNPIVTVRGSGRVADELADPSSERRRQLPPDARLYVADLHSPQAFMGLAYRLLTGGYSRSHSGIMGR